jgi:hypothetical protein
MYNYSVYALGTLTGLDLEYFWEMALDPEMREYMTVVSRKPRPDETVTRLEPARWTEVVVEAEPCWIRQVPPDTRQRILGPDPVGKAMSLELSRREAELDRRAGVVTATQHELDKNRREVVRLVGEVERLNDYLRREVTRLVGEINMLNDYILEQSASIEDQAAAIEKQQDEINSRDAMLQSLQGEAARLQQQLADAQQAINLRDALLDESRARFNRTVEGLVLTGSHALGRLLRRAGILPRE